LVAAACAEPELDEPAQPQGDPEPLGSEEPDPERDELITQLEAFATAVEDVREPLRAAIESDDASRVRVAADDALGAFAADTEGTTVFPSQTGESERESGDDDLLRTTLAQARTVGGELGGDTVEILRDPIAGDLGAWERSPQEMFESTVAAAEEADDLDAATEAVLDLAGDGPRAIAWLALTRDTSDDQLALEAATQADGHLEVIVLAIGFVLDEAEGEEDDGADDPDDDADDGDEDGDGDEDAAP
ncbi:MAG: hypothetical protein ACLFRD_11595, partial [Nitriliruptoraceae bacterium]